MAAFDTTGQLFGGYAVDRKIFRRLFPDARLVVYGAGLVDPADANTATISIVYQKDDTSTVTLGSATQTGAGKVKLHMGPFDVFGTAGVPQGERVPVVRLFAAKNAGAAGTIECWVLWFRLFTERA